MPLVIGGNAFINAGTYAWIESVHGRDISLGRLAFEASIGAAVGAIGGNSSDVLRSLNGHYTISNIMILF